MRTVKSGRVLAIVALLFGSAPLLAATFHVAPSGDDANPGTPEKPFATLTRARDAVRELRRARGGLQEPVTVHVRGGRYSLRDTLVLMPEDSGTEKCPITYTEDDPPPAHGVRRVERFMSMATSPAVFHVDNLQLERMNP
jgi:hypothetical protein